MTDRVCAWCSEPIPARARKDSICCSKRCRQARNRFDLAARAGRQLVDGQHQPSGPVRLAYADPPYPGNARLYRGHPDYAGEVDHAGLVDQLCAYDGWALSTSAAALPAVLAVCPPAVRVAAWHRGEVPAVSWHPQSAWEPVVYVPGRSLLSRPSDGRRRRVDSLVHGVAPMTTLPGRVVGAKPAAVSVWIFGLLGALPGDQLHDLFPGSGAVARAWRAYASGTATVDASARAASDASARGGRDASPAGP